MNPIIGTIWRFKGLDETTKAEADANRFVVVGRDGDWVDYMLLGSHDQPTRRKVRDFHKNFERVTPPIE